MRRPPRRTRRHTVLLLGLMATCGLAAPAAAQPPTSPTAGWDDGFVVQSADRSYRLVFGLVLQADGRFAVDDPVPTINTFTLRKLRPTFSGTIGRWVGFRFMPEFGSGSVDVQDAWVELRFSPAFRLRAGKDKTPVGYEMLVGDPWVLFPERSLANSLVPNRDVGFQAQGDLLGARVFYAAGVFNGVVDGASSVGDRDTNNAKDLAGRVVVRPFRVSAHVPLRGLGFQVGGSAGTQAGSLPVFRSPAGQTYFAYGGAAAAEGGRSRLTPAVFYYEGPIGAFVEYMRSAQSVATGGVPLDVVNQGWNVTGSYVLTGETTSDRGVRPESPFDPASGGRGAVQLLVRWARLAVDRDVFRAGVAAPGANRQASSVGLGVDWYITDAVKYYTSFERTTFEGGTPRPAEHVLFLRLQMAF